MMCNPNMPQSGSTPNGSPTGKQPQTTNPLLSDLLEDTLKTSHEIAVKVARLRSLWLARQLKELGMPDLLLDGVHDGEPGLMRLARRWLRMNGFAYATRDINTIQLYRHGELVADETLFKAPLYYDSSS